MNDFVDTVGAKEINPLDIGGPFMDMEEPNQELARSLNNLETKIYQNMKPALEERLRTNPKPTNEEIVLGSFLEQIEIPVRSAVRTFNNKGYPTDSSGFYGRNYQTIDGHIYLSDDETKVLEAAGAMVKRRPNGYCYISFIPDSANEEAITAKWNHIAEALPDRGPTSHMSSTSGSQEFRKKYSTPEEVERVRIERQLIANDIYYGQTREGLEERLKELKKGKID